MVGRDLLIGAVLGVCLTLLLQLGVVLPPLFGRPSPLPILTWLGAFTNVPYHLLMEFVPAIRDQLLWFFLLFLLVLFFRREWLASILVFSVVLIYFLVQEPELHIFWVVLLGATVIASLYVTLRFGLLAAAVGSFFCYYLYQIPLSLNLSAWYGWQSLVYMLWPILLAGAGFSIARGENPSLGEI